jgi:hypothetical protein
VTSQGWTVSDVRDLLQDEGYAAKIDKTDNGDPVVRSAASGWKFNIYLKGVHGDGRASSLYFWAGMQTDRKRSQMLDIVNDWNGKWRYTKTWVDEEDDLILEMDVVVAHGVTPRALAYSVERWSEGIGEISTHLAAYDQS